MSNTETAAVVRRYFEGDHDGRDNTEHWDEICDARMTLFAALLPTPLEGLEHVRAFTVAMHQAMSEFSLSVDEVIAEGDAAAARWTMRGRHTGTLALPTGMLNATGRTVVVTGMSFLRIAGGKLVEERVEADWLGALQQLGVFPGPA